MGLGATYRFYSSGLSVSTIAIKVFLKHRSVERSDFDAPIDETSAKNATADLLHVASYPCTGEICKGIKNDKIVEKLWNAVSSISIFVSSIVGRGSYASPHRSLCN